MTQGKDASTDTNKEMMTKSEAYVVWREMAMVDTDQDSIMTDPEGDLKAYARWVVENLERVKEALWREEFDRVKTATHPMED